MFVDFSKVAETSTFSQLFYQMISGFKNFMYMSLYMYIIWVDSNFRPTLYYVLVREPPSSSAFKQLIQFSNFLMVLDK